MDLLTESPDNKRTRLQTFEEDDEEFDGLVFLGENCRIFAPLPMEGDHDDVATGSDTVEASTMRIILRSTAQGTHLAPELVLKFRDHQLTSMMDSIRSVQPNCDLDRAEIEAVMHTLHWNSEKVMSAAEFVQFIPVLEDFLDKLKLRRARIANATLPCLVCQCEDEEDGSRLMNCGCHHKMHPECWK